MGIAAPGSEADVIDYFEASNLLFCIGELFASDDDGGALRPGRRGDSREFG